MELTFFKSHFVSLFCEDGCKEPSGTILRATSAQSNLVKLSNVRMRVWGGLRKKFETCL